MEVFVTEHEFDEDDEHILTLLRGVRDLLALGQADAAVQVAIHLGGVLAEQEAHSHLFWHLGERSAKTRLSVVSTYETDLAVLGREDFWLIVALRGSEDETEIHSG